MIKYNLEKKFMNKSKVFCNIFLEKNIDFDENEIKIKRVCMNSQEVEKDDLVSFLHSFFVIAPRIISIDDPGFMLGEKVIHLG